MRIRTALAALAAGVATVACGETVTRSSASDERRMEREIAADLQDQSGDPYVEVDCPRFRMRRGEEFQCLAVDGYGDRYAVYTYIEDDDGSYVWEVQ